MKPAQILANNVTGRDWSDSHDAQVAGAAKRILSVGAVAPLDYKGMGATGIVFCDARGIGYKAARNPREATYRASMEAEADWLRVASVLPEIKAHIAGFRHFYRTPCVIERQCIRGSSNLAESRRRGKDTRWDLHHAIKKVMLANGFGMPEFKEDSYVWQSGRGWVLVDASNPILTGHRLVARAVQTLSGKRFPLERPADVSWALGMESERTVDPGRVERLRSRLDRLPDAEVTPRQRRRA